MKNDGTPTKDGTLVFVYGTLREGETNARHLEGLRSIGTVKTAPRYTMISLGAFPGIIERGTTAVTGELYRVDDATLARLDRLEGHPHFYERKDVEIESVGGVQGYVLPDKHLTHPMIGSGDWRSSPYSRHYKGKGGPVGAFADHERDEDDEDCDA